MKIDDMVDIVLLVTWLALGLVTVLTCLTIINSKITDYTMGDKIALSAYNDNTPDEFIWDTEDVLLMYMIADEYQPYPSKLAVNTGRTVDFDKSYFNDTNGAINRIWNEQLSSLMGKKVKQFELTYDSGGGNVRWKITTD